MSRIDWRMSRMDEQDRLQVDQYRLQDEQAPLTMGNKYMPLPLELSVRNCYRYLGRRNCENSSVERGYVKLEFFLFFRGCTV